MIRASHAGARQLPIALPLQPPVAFQFAAALTDAAEFPAIPEPMPPPSTDTLIGEPESPANPVHTFTNAASMFEPRLSAKGAEPISLTSDDTRDPGSMLAERTSPSPAYTTFADRNNSMIGRARHTSMQHTCGAEMSGFLQLLRSHMLRGDDHLGVGIHGSNGL